MKQIPFSNEDIASFEYISNEDIDQNYGAAGGYGPISQEVDAVLMDYILICKRYNLLLAKLRKEI